MKKIKEKTIEYFPHDYHARNDLQEIMLLLGHEGKSVYWDLVEMLHENGGYLEMSKLSAIAYTLRTSDKVMETLLSEKVGLFKTDGTLFWSDRVIRGLKKRLEISEERSKAGQIGSTKRWQKQTKKGKVSEPKEEPKIDYVKFDNFEFVKLTADEWQKILEKWGNTKAIAMVEYLDIWLDSGTKKAKEARKAKSHKSYFRCDGWVSQGADELLRKKQANVNNGVSSDYGSY